MVDLSVVTGGASGIGLAIAELLHNRGSQVVILDIDADLAQKQAERIGKGAFAYVADVSDDQQLEQIARRIDSEVGEITKLVTSAAVLQPEPARPEDLDISLFNKIMDVNVCGTYNACKVFGGRMAKQGHGAIVTIASISGVLGTPLHAYGPAKAAVIKLTENLAPEWGRSGVRINSVAPGHTLTAPLQAMIDAGHRDLAQISDTTATGRIATPGEIASVVAFLLSDEASAVTGTNLVVDNGAIITLPWHPFGGSRARRAPN